MTDSCHHIYVTMFSPFKSDYFLWALTSRCRRLGYTPERQKEIADNVTMKRQKW